MKRVFTLLLASAVALSLFGCSKETGSDQSSSKGDTSSPDGKVSVWLPISKTQYNADGSKGSRQTTYSYTDKGLPLTETIDDGLQEEFWNEELKVYEIISHSFDGTPNREYHYYYNEQGDYLYYSYTTNTYGSDGKLENSQTKNLSKDLCKYNYRSDGKIDSVEWYSQSADGTVNEQVTAIYHHCYDERGNLVEIYNENLTADQTRWVYDFRYDAENRLIASVIRNREASYQYQYSYDSQGRLTDVKKLYGHWQTPLDDQHVSQSTDANNYSSFSDLGGAHFTYDSNGNLIFREGSSPIECTYDTSGNLSTVTSGDIKYVFVDDEANADNSANTLVRDKHGNIVKVIDSDGDYVEYEYQEFRLTPEEATKCQNILLAKSNVDPLGYKPLSQYFSFREGDGFLGYLPLVQTILHPIDVLNTQS